MFQTWLFQTMPLLQKSNKTYRWCHVWFINIIHTRLSFNPGPFFPFFFFFFRKASQKSYLWRKESKEREREREGGRDGVDLRTEKVQVGKIVGGFCICVYRWRRDRDLSKLESFEVIWRINFWFCFWELFSITKTKICFLLFFH
jgi:hypothetical protein